MKMKNDNILVSLFNKQEIMFVESEKGVEVVNNIKEHIDRLTELSENQHIYMDDVAFKALGTLQNRFTRVFTNKKNFEKGANLKFRLHHSSELHSIVEMKMVYEPETKIFFIGSSNFLLKCSKYCNLMLATVCESTIDKTEYTYVDKIPTELKEQFTKRRDIHPEKADEIRAYKKLKARELEGLNVTYADNGMKIIDTSLSKIDKSNPLLSQPDYMFYEFRK